MEGLSEGYRKWLLENGHDPDDRPPARHFDLPDLPELTAPTPQVPCPLPSRNRVIIMGVVWGSCFNDGSYGVEDSSWESFSDFIPSKNKKRFFPTRENGHWDLDYLLFNSRTGFLKILRYLNGGDRKKYVFKRHILDLMREI